MLRQSLDEPLGALAGIVREYRGRGVPEPAILRALEWASAGHRTLTADTVAAVDHALFMEAAALTGMTIAVHPKELREFDEFKGPAQPPHRLLDLTRLVEIRTRVAKQLATGELHLTRSDLEFIEREIFPLGRLVHTMRGFERGAGEDSARVELTTIFPEDFLDGLRALFANRSRPEAAPDPEPMRRQSPAEQAAREAGLLRQLPPDVRRAVFDDVSRVAISFDLHRWRDAVRGDPAGEQLLLDLLRTANVGTAPPGSPPAAEIDLRLKSMPDRPTSVNMLQLRIELEKAHHAWAKSPADGALALRYLRIRVLLGAFARGTASALPVVWPGPGERITPGEAAQLLVHDAARCAISPRDRALALEHLARLARVAGLMHPGDGALLQSIHRLRALADSHQWDRFWPSFLELRQRVMRDALREVWR
jgi:hypothetical protein